MIIARNIAAVILGLLVAGTVNMSLITIGPGIIPPPAGVDVTNLDAMASSMHLFEPRHFLFPFLAHAAGTFAGSFVAYLIAGSNKAMYAYALGVLGLIGGIYASTIIPAPSWFIAVDLILAYLPCAWLASFIGPRLTNP